MTSENYKRMIVKVQIPVMTNENECLALVYNEDRSFQAQTPFEEEDLIVMGKEFKKFFWAEVKGGKLILGKPAPWQSW